MLLISNTCFHYLRIKFHDFVHNPHHGNYSIFIFLMSLCPRNVWLRHTGSSWRKRSILTCIWRNIKKGYNNNSYTIERNHYNVAPTIYLPVPRTELFKRSVYYYRATLWNSLSSEIRSCDNITEFKNQLYKIIL